MERWECGEVGVWGGGSVGRWDVGRWECGEVGVWRGGSVESGSVKWDGSEER